MSAGTSRCTEEHCITCGDVAARMHVVAVDETTALALCVSDDGERETVDVTLVAPIRPADRLLVHAGTAITVEQAV